jgi:hypothetical protein
LIGFIAERVSSGETMTITDNSAADVKGTVALSGGESWLENDIVRITSSGTFFVFRPESWDSRLVGDDTTNKFPTFVDREINDVFYHLGRFGMVSGESVHLSESGNLFNFFRSTAQQLLDGDRIDIDQGGPTPSFFHSAVQWNQELILWSDMQQYMLTKPRDSVFSPRNVKLDKIGDWENSATVRPVVTGPSIMFLNEQQKYVDAFEFFWDDRERTFKAEKLTKHVAKYIPITPIGLAASSTYGLAAVLSNSDQSDLYVYSYAWEGGQKVMSGWSLWDFNTNDTILAIDFVDSTMGLVVSRDEGIFFETIPLDSDYTDAGITTVRHLDRRMTQADVTPEFVEAAQYSEAFVYADATDITAIGFGASGTGFMQTKDQELIANWAGAFQITVGYPYATNVLEVGATYEYYADIKRGTSGLGCGLIFWCDDGGTGTSADHLLCYLDNNDANTVNCRFAMIDGGSTYYAELVSAAVPLQEGNWLRLVVVMNGATFTAYYEPKGGGTRTLIGTWSLYAGSFHTDSDHLHVGVVYSGTGNVSTGWRWDNLYITRTDVTDYTKWTLPFDIPEADGTLRVVLKSDGSILSTTRPSADVIQSTNATDYSSTDVYIGWKYTFTWQPSIIYLRDREDRPRTSGRLQLAYLDLRYMDSMEFDVVTNTNRVGGSSRTRSLALSAPGTGWLHVPVQSQNDNVTIQVTDDSPGAVWISRLRWEGSFTDRARRFG